MNKLHIHSLILTVIGLLMIAVAPTQAQSTPQARERIRATVAIPQTFSVNFDSTPEVKYERGESTPDRDIWFNAITATERYFQPMDGAEIAAVTSTASEFAGCSNATYSTQRIDVTQFPQSSYICVKTSQGRYVEVQLLRLDEYIRTEERVALVNFPKMVLAYTTWDALPLAPAAPAPPAAPTPPQPAAVTQCQSQIGVLLPIECETLVALYQATNGANWTNNTGWIDWSVSPCDWFGVTCNGNGAGTNVIYLTLKDNNLDGVLLPELANLTRLNQLKLDFNNLTGSIPAALGGLSNLSVLYLDLNQLTGEIPAALGNLNASQIQLGGNQLTGEIPAELGNLTGLRILYLNANQLTGSIPAALGNTALEQFAANDNQLSGRIPAALGNAPLQNIQLHNNMLSGDLSAALFAPTLNLLYLHNNELKGVIPHAIGDTVMTQLVIDRNRLGGSIPPVMGSLPLTNFNLAGNAFEGEIPQEITQLTAILPNQCLVAFNKLMYSDAAIVQWIEDTCDGERSRRQTIPPFNVSAHAIDSTSVEIRWQGLDYIDNGGFYEVLYREFDGAVFEVWDATSDKATTSLEVTDLDANKAYEFVVRTVTLPHGEQNNRLVSEWSERVNSTESAGLLELADLSINNDFLVNINDGIPQLAQLEIPVDTTISNPTGQAMDIISDIGLLYQFEDVTEELYLDRVVLSEDTADDGLNDKHLFFAQKWDEIPVFGSSVSAHIVDDIVTSTSGNYIVDLPDQLPEARLTGTDAEAIVTATFADALIFGEAKEVIYAPALLGDDDDNTYRTWRVNVRIGTAEKAIFVDAVSGDVVEQISLTVHNEHAHAHKHEQRVPNSLDVGTFQRYAVFTCFTYDDIWFTENGATADYPGIANDSFEDGQEAYDSINTVYNYFDNRFDHKSYDGHDEHIDIVVDRDREGAGNAWFAWFCDVIHLEDGMATLDVIAHEYAHGVDNNSADLTYKNESGALSESFADVFAALIDGNWEIGEESIRGTMRDLSNPPRFGDPDHVRDMCSETNDFCNFDDDNGGVHTNSSIPNKVAYLLVEGGMHNGISVDGMGKNKVEQLYYDVLTERLSSSADFEDARHEMIVQVSDYLSGGSNPASFSLRDACAVAAAWESVGVGSAGDCFAAGAFDDQFLVTDYDGDLVPNYNDNCVNTPNTDQSNNNDDKIGDACDSDDDNDGVLDEATVNASADNCQFVANPDQADFDGDGNGDVCDDFDGDGVVDADDNCIFQWNPSQINIDGDGTGDACDIDADNDGIYDYESDFTVGAIDNCRYIPNSGQLDSDNDGVGNACDNCSAIANSGQGDIDEDGIGDVCDDDEDGDGIADSDDACPSDYDPTPIDIDGDGIPAACDDFIDLPFTQLEQIANIPFPTNGDPLDIPLPVPGGDCIVCNNDLSTWVIEQPDTHVVLEFDQPLAVQIVDELGQVVVSSNPALSHDLTFSPEPESNFILPELGMLPQSRSKQNTASYSINGYTLQLIAAPGSEGQPVDMGIAINPTCLGTDCVALSVTHSAQSTVSNGHELFVVSSIIVMLIGTFTWHISLKQKR